MNLFLQGTISNKAVPTWEVTDPTQIGVNLANIIVTLWRIVMVLGSLAVLVFFIMGGIAWLTAGGEEAKVEEARNRMTNALIGMVILFASFAFFNYIGPAIGFDLLNVQLPDNYSTNTN